MTGSLSPRIRSTAWVTRRTNTNQNCRNQYSKDTRHCHSMCLIILAVHKKRCWSHAGTRGQDIRLLLESLHIASIARRRHKCDNEITRTSFAASFLHRTFRGTSRDVASWIHRHSSCDTIPPGSTLRLTVLSRVKDTSHSLDFCALLSMETEEF